MNNFDIIPTQNKQKRPNNCALVWIFFTLKEGFFFFFSFCVCLVFHFERGHLIIWSVSADTSDKRTNTPNKSADTQHLGAYGLKCFDIHVNTKKKTWFQPIQPILSATTICIWWYCHTWRKVEFQAEYQHGSYYLQITTVEEIHRAIGNWDFTHPPFQRFVIIKQLPPLHPILFSICGISTLKRIVFYWREDH